MVYSNAGALAFTPTAQHRNFEIWVVPRVQCASFADAKPADVQAVADVRRAPCACAHVLVCSCLWPRPNCRRDWLRWNSTR